MLQLALSARTEEALSNLAVLYADWLQTHEDLSLEDVCHTANTGRNHFEHRAVLLCTSREGAREQLVALARGEKKSSTALITAIHLYAPKMEWSRSSAAKSRKAN